MFISVDIFANLGVMNQALQKVGYSTILEHNNWTIRLILSNERFALVGLKNSLNKH